MLYKSGITTYVVKNIPVGLWKKCKTRLLENWITDAEGKKWN